MLAGVFLYPALVEGVAVNVKVNPELKAYDTIEKLSEHESVIGVYIYPYKTGMRSVTIELSSGRQIEGDAFVSLANAVKSAQDRLTEHLEAGYETL